MNKQEQILHDVLKSNLDLTQIAAILKEARTEGMSSIDKLRHDLDGFTKSLKNRCPLQSDPMPSPLPDIRGCESTLDNIGTEFAKFLSLPPITRKCGDFSKSKPSFDSSKLSVNTQPFVRSRKEKDCQKADEEEFSVDSVVPLPSVTCEQATLASSPRTSLPKIQRHTKVQLPEQPKLRRCSTKCNSSKPAQLVLKQTKQVDCKAILEQMNDWEGSRQSIERYLQNHQKSLQKYEVENEQLRTELSALKMQVQMMNVEFKEAQQKICGMNRTLLCYQDTKCIEQDANNRAKERCPVRHVAPMQPVQNVEPMQVTQPTATTYPVEQGTHQSPTLFIHHLYAVPDEPGCNTAVPCTIAYDAKCTGLGEMLSYPILQKTQDDVKADLLDQRFNELTEDMQNLGIFGTTPRNDFQKLQSISPERLRSEFTGLGFSGSPVNNPQASKRPSTHVVDSSSSEMRSKNDPKLEDEFLELKRKYTKALQLLSTKI